MTIANGQIQDSPRDNSDNKKRQIYLQLPAQSKQREGNQGDKNMQIVTKNLHSVHSLSQHLDMDQKTNIKNQNRISQHNGSMLLATERDENSELKNKI